MRPRVRAQHFGVSPPHPGHVIVRHRILITTHATTRPKRKTISRISHHRILYVTDRLPRHLRTHPPYSTYRHTWTAMPLVARRLRLQIDSARRRRRGSTCTSPRLAAAPAIPACHRRQRHEGCLRPPVARLHHRGLFRVGSWTAPAARRPRCWPDSTPLTVPAACRWPATNWYLRGSTERQR